MTLTRVLIVDDEPFICTTVSMLLRLEGFEVSSAADGRAGLQAALASRPDIILSDLNMPHMDGYQLLAAVRASPAIAGCRFVLLSGEVQTGAAVETRGVAADARLPKPFTRDQLLHVIRSVVN